MDMPVSWTNPPDIVYPESDGKALADNTEQLEWIVRLFNNLESQYRDDPDVFVAGNQLWYPIKGEPEICVAPDVYVVFGRPKGFRSSWKQWEENDIPMTVVFEVLSPSNDAMEMVNKHSFYDEHGVEEYYIYDPHRKSLSIFIRRGIVIRREWKVDGFVSPRLGIRFDMTGDDLVIYGVNGTPFVKFSEIADQLQSTQRSLNEIEQRMARLVELSRKARRGTATPNEIAELDRLESE